VAEPTRGAGGAWRTIDELAALVGVYCWLEDRIFEATGAWATAPDAPDPGTAELRLWSAAASRRHGALAGRWAEHLPVRAGVDPDALVAAPSAPAGLVEALEELAATKELAVGATALVETVLPWVGGVYGSHLAVATPVSEASVMEVLVEARREGSAEIRSGRTLLGRLEEAGKPSGHLGEPFERAFVHPGVFPAVRAS
jgi:hypothetical protein